MTNDETHGHAGHIREMLRAAASRSSLARAHGEPRDFPKRPGREVDSVKSKTLGAAARLLADGGAGKLSLRAIADNAGVGLASIYHYFAGKEELLLQLAITGFRELREDMIQFQSSSELVSPMRASARAFFNFALTRPALFSLMFDEGLMARHEDLRDAERRAFQVYQEALSADGRIPPSHVEGVSHALWAMGRGMASIISSHPDGKVPIELADKILSGAAYLLNHRERPTS